MTGIENGPWWLVAVVALALLVFAHFFRAERRWLRERDRAVHRMIAEAYDEAGAFPFDQECQ